MTWGNDEQKRRYLPAACRGEKVLAFGLTEPEAGSNPLEMQMTYERRGDRVVLNGVKYLISNAGIATTVVLFAYPLTPNPSPPGGEGLGVRGGKRVSAFIADLVDGPNCQRENLTAKMGMPTANTGMFELTDYEPHPAIRSIPVSP